MSHIIQKGRFTLLCFEFFFFESPVTLNFDITPLFLLNCPQALYAHKT